MTLPLYALRVPFKFAVVISRTGRALEAPVNLSTEWSWVLTACRIIGITGFADLIDTLRSVATAITIPLAPYASIPIISSETDRGVSFTPDVTPWITELTDPTEADPLVSLTIVVP